MKASELRKNTQSELTAELEGLLRAEFSLRMQLAGQQLTNKSLLSKARKDIARVKTVMTEMKGVI